jgi:hypothetical protein
MHPQMALELNECVELTHIPNKITAIIPTGPASINCLLWSVFSLLLQSKVNGPLEHICVCINGPDERTGNPELQDKKQKFLEALRDMNWYHADEPDVKRQMPLTVIRAWSRVGYAEPFEMAIPWVHTANYLLMHDDVIITRNDWAENVSNTLASGDKVALVYCGELIGRKCKHAIHRGMYLLCLPQLETIFVACKKKWLIEGPSWQAYHIPSDSSFLQFELSEIGDIEEMQKYWRDLNMLDDPLQDTELYNFVRQDIGSWVYYHLSNKGCEFKEIPKDTILHIEGMSGNGETGKKIRTMGCMDYIEELEELISSHPEYSKLYWEFKDAS